MTTIFERLGLPEEASAEEINGAIRKFYGANFTAKLPTELLTAYGQREREAGKREGWDEFCGNICLYRHECCDTFDTCPARDKKEQPTDSLPDKQG